MKTLFYTLTLLLSLSTALSTQAADVCDQAPCVGLPSKVESLGDLTRVLAQLKKAPGSYVLVNENSTSAQAADYRNILQDFDIKTIALLGAGAEIKNISSFEFVKNRAAENRSLRQNLNFEQIKSWDEFLAMAEELLGHKILFRDFDTTLTSEVKGYDEKLRLLSGEVFRRSLLNRMLEVKDIQKPEVGGAVRASISYTSMKTLKRLASEKYFSKELTKKIAKIKIDPSGEYASPEIKSLYREALKELAIFIFQSARDPRLVSKPEVSGTRAFVELEIYMTFISLQPFAEGNAQVARLLFQYATWFRGNSQASLDLPFYDLDLLGSSEVTTYLGMGRFLRNWVSEAADDQDFIDRCTMALKAMLQLEPDLKHHFPEVKLILP